MTPPDEIEITPEMIEAGVDALTSWGPDHLSSTVVVAVFDAMLRVSKPQSCRLNSLEPEPHRPTQLRP